MRRVSLSTTKKLIKNLTSDCDFATKKVVIALLVEGVITVKIYLVHKIEPLWGEPCTIAISAHVSREDAFNKCKALEAELLAKKRQASMCELCPIWDVDSGISEAIKRCKSYCSLFAPPQDEALECENYEKPISDVSYGVSVVELLLPENKGITISETSQQLAWDLIECHSEFVTLQNGEVYTDYGRTAALLVERGWVKVE